MISITIDPMTSTLMAFFIAWAFRIDSKTKRIEVFLTKHFKNYNEV